MPPAKKSAVDDEISSLSGEDGTIAPASSAPPATDTASILAAFKANFRQELRASLPGMVERSLGNLLEPLQQQQQTLQTETQRLRHDVGRLHEAQVQQAIDMKAQMSELAEAIRGLRAQPPPAGAGGSERPPNQTSDQPAPAFTPSAPRPPGKPTVPGGSGSRPLVGCSAPPTHEGRIVLMKFASRELRGNMEGLEQSARSRLDYKGPPPTYSGLRYHTHLTLHFGTYSDADAYSGALRKAGVTDRLGRPVIYSHKDRVDSRPPKVKRRGAAMATVFDALKPALTANEKLDMAHETKGSEPFSIFIAINEAPSSVRELVKAFWTDDGEKVRITRFAVFLKDVPENVRQAASSAAGL